MSDGPTIVTASEDETRRLAARLARSGAIEAGDCLALVGELGAGKTQFVKGFAGGLGIDPDEVTSPTFTLLHVYDEGKGDGIALHHVDAYRLGGADEALPIGLDRHLACDGIALVEWADRVAELLPGEARLVRIRFEHVSEHERRITIEQAPARMAEALADAFKAEGESES